MKVENTSLSIQHRRVSNKRLTIFHLTLFFLIWKRWMTDDWSGSLCKRKTMTAFLRNIIQFEYEEIYETFNCFDTFYLTQFIAVISKASEARKRDKM